MATARPKISLKIRVLRDEKTAGDWGKLFDESVNVQLVIDWSMEKAAAQTQSRLEFQRVEACLSEEALERRGTEHSILGIVASCPGLCPQGRHHFTVHSCNRCVTALTTMCFCFL